MAIWVKVAESGAILRAQPAAVPAPAIQIVVVQGSVAVLPANGTAWIPAKVRQIINPRDRIHTETNSRVVVRWSDQTILTFGASTELEILPPRTADEDAGLQLLRGITSFFHRDQPGRIRIITRGAMAGVVGTEFVMAVDDHDRTTVSVIDGQVRLGNDQATLLLTNAQEAGVDLGQAPVRTAGFVANNLLQWCFYYPAVIDPDELPLTPEETHLLGESLMAYRAGDLQTALAQFPTNAPRTDAVRVYRAALLLSVGEVAGAVTALEALPGDSERINRLAGAVRQLIAAVKGQPLARLDGPGLNSEYLASSYWEQAQANRKISLAQALKLAQTAVKNAPQFGFGWERVAELEFSFGQNAAALDALNRSLALAPANAQALALKGFVLAEQNQPEAARSWFDRAIGADAALGNAWLGRGLARIRLGDPAGGKEDLLVAAALEPQRSELRSYLGKAYTATGDDARAAKELAQARRLDPNDPTPWLYSALLNQQNNQINQAIRDLEKSQALNNNRSVYRSQLLLDQDSALRSANLASIYQDAGMYDTSLNEAGRAVSSDYGNYSAHLFLAGSYEQLRAPEWSNLRYDAPAGDEFWIANLLAPTGAGWLSATLAEQPHAQLFDHSRFGAVSDTTYLSRGAWTENADEFYTSDKFAFDFGTSYQFDPGQRANQDFEQREFDINLKGQLTPHDSLFGSIQLAEVDSGDVNQYYHPSAASPANRTTETQEPNLFLGYHHDWSPGVQTLFLASRQVSDSLADASNAGQYIGQIRGDAYTTNNVFFPGNNLNARIQTEKYSIEFQQLWEQESHTTILGSRYDWGSVRYQNLELNDSGLATFYFPAAPLVTNQDFTLDYHHVSLYGYHTWQIVDPLSFTAGFSYDLLHLPADPTTAPFVQADRTKAQISPKAGLVWTPTAGTAMRVGYTRSLSGFAGAQNTQLEPTEVAGFNQAFQGLIPASVAGDTSGSCIDAINVSWEEKFPTGTYLILSAADLYSKLSDVQGAFVSLYDSPLDYATYPLGFQQKLDYHERTAAVRVDQLLGEQWVLGAKYSISQARLNASYPQIPPGYDKAPFRQHQTLESVLQTVKLNANWNHPSGVFTILESAWYHQSNAGFALAEPGDDFWQLNAYAGYRFCHRKMEFSVGVLNLTDQNYRLEPLNLYNEMARSRTFLARLLISF